MPFPNSNRELVASRECCRCSCDQLLRELICDSRRRYSSEPRLDCLNFLNRISSIHSVVFSLFFGSLILSTLGYTLETWNFVFTTGFLCLATVIATLTINRLLNHRQLHTILVMLFVYSTVEGLCSGGLILFSASGHPIIAVLIFAFGTTGWKVHIIRWLRDSMPHSYSLFGVFIAIGVIQGVSFFGLLGLASFGRYREASILTGIMIFNFGEILETWRRNVYRKMNKLNYHLGLTERRALHILDCMDVEDLLDFMDDLHETLLIPYLMHGFNQERANSFLARFSQQLRRPSMEHWNALLQFVFGNRVTQSENRKSVPTTSAGGQPANDGEGSRGN